MHNIFQKSDQMKLEKVFNWIKKKYPIEGGRTVSLA